MKRASIKNSYEIVYYEIIILLEFHVKIFTQLFDMKTLCVR